MKKIFLILFAVFITLQVYARPYLYVSHKNIPKITVIDTAINKILREVDLEMTASNMALSPDNKYLYFSSIDTNAVYRLKTKNLTLDDDFVSVGYEPVALAVSGDNKKIYVANSGSNNLSVIELPSFEVKKSPIKLPGKPVAITIADDNRRVFIALSGRAGIAMIDALTKKMYKIKTGVEPWGMCIYKNNLYVTNEAMSSISVVSLKTYKITNEIVTSEGPRGIAALRNLLYVGVNSGLDIFETVKYQKPAAIGLDYDAYDIVSGDVPSGKKVYIAGYNKRTQSGCVYVIDPKINEVIKEIKMTDSMPNQLEIKRNWPTLTPTKTMVKAKTFTPTATMRPTKRPTKKRPTKKPTLKIRKKKRPRPTATPDILKSTLTGKVWMRKSPAVNIKVRAMNDHSGKIVSTRTDNSGRFTFYKLPIGAYVISIESTNIKGKAISVTVNKGKNRELIISVQKR